MTSYEFVIVRYVHSVATDEFVNIGVAMWVPSERRFAFKISDRYARLSSFFKGFDGSAYRQTVKVLIRRFERLANRIESRLLGDVPEGFEPVLQMALPQDASAFRLSEIMVGLADDPLKRLQQLTHEYVERFEAVGPRERHDEAEIVERIDLVLQRAGLAGRVQTGVEVTTRDYAYRFQFGWMNGGPQVMEPISFDYLTAGDVLEKATNWSGKLLTLSRGKQFEMTGVVSPPSRRDLSEVYERAVRILRAAPNVRQVVSEADLETTLVPIIRKDLQTEH